MRIMMFRCETKGCRFTTESEAEYNRHVKAETKIAGFLEAFPPVKDSGCRFANGDWNVKRNCVWVENLKTAVEKIVGTSAHSPWTYAWFRTLDDSDSMFYPLAMRVLNICKTCNREWGQPYYANNCDHKDKPCHSK